MCRAIFILLLLFLGACSNIQKGDVVCGADEFVLDSYKIRDGKLAILEMLGKELDELDDELLEGEFSAGNVLCLDGQKVRVDGKMRLYDVLTKIKIPEETNFFSSSLVRDGKEIPVDFARLVTQGDVSQNILMQGGDRVYLAPKNSASCFVVQDNGVQEEVFLPTGCISLRSALVSTKNLPWMNDSSMIHIVRGSIPIPKQYVLNWKHVAMLPSESLLLMPGDTVYISSSSLRKRGLARERKTD